MLVEYEQVSTIEEEKAVIKAVAKTSDIQNAIELLEGNADPKASISIFLCPIIITLSDSSIILEID